VEVEGLDVRVCKSRRVCGKESTRVWETADSFRQLQVLETMGWLRVVGSLKL